MNPLTMAGFAVMQGVPMGQALMGAAEANRQNQMAQAQMAEHQAKLDQAMRARLFAQNLPETIRGLGASSVEDATAKLIAIGADPEQALKLAQGIRPDIKEKYNPVTGGIDTFENGRYRGPVSQGVVQSNNMAPQNAFLNTPKGQMLTAEQQLLEGKEISREQRGKLDKINETANLSSEALTRIRQMQELANDFYQGPGAEAVKLAGKGLNVFTGKDLGAAAAETFEAESKQLLLDLNTKLKGATSDKDVVLLKTAGPELMKTKQGNKNLLNALEAQFARGQQYAEAAEMYYTQYGTLQGFDAKWRKYANAFPLVKKTGEGTLDLNQDNLHNWQMVLDPDFDMNISALQGASKVIPEQSAPNKRKASNGKLYTVEQLKAIAGGM